jgi:NTE family protein
MQWLSHMSVPQLVPSIAEEPSGDLAIMLTGGGARAAYQVGLLKGLARYFPDLKLQIVTGVSAGAINAMYLAAHHGTLAEKVRTLETMWLELTCSSIFEFDWKAFLPFRTALASLAVRNKWSKTRPHGMLNTAPLRELLCRVLNVRPGEPIAAIERNIQEGDLKALALMTLDYSTGQTVRWVQGRYFEFFEGVNRRSAPTRFTVDHVLASSALPFVFPAVRIGGEWHGDGGIRLAAPLSAPVHLGASRIIAMSTGYQRTADEANTPVIGGYPPAAQILGQLVNAIFLDVIDEDVARMQRMSELLRKMHPHDRDGLKPIDLLVLRPSQDLGKLAGQYEKNLPRQLKFLVRALGGKETESLELVSLLLFEPGYTRALIDLGEADVHARATEIQMFFGEEATTIAAARPI